MATPINAIKVRRANKFASAVRFRITARLGDINEVTRRLILCGKGGCY